MNTKPTADIPLVDGELYWIRIKPDGGPFIATYTSTSRDRNGYERGPAFWVDLRAVFGPYEVIEHIKKPETRK